MKNPKYGHFMIAALSFAMALLVVTPDLVGMQRPTAMGLPQTIKENCLVKACSKCCSSECCPVATLVVTTEVFLCGFLVNPELSQICDPSPERKVIKVGMGVALLTVLGGSKYIANKCKRD